MGENKNNPKVKMSTGKQSRRQSQEENLEEGSRTFSFKIVEEEEAMSS